LRDLGAAARGSYISKTSLDPAVKRALLGKRLDDEVDLRLPRRQRTLRVIAIA
jgi:transcription elongation GreA/GreB family factor